MVRWFGEFRSKNNMDSKETTLHELLAGLPDPRSRRGRRHSLEEVLLIAVLAVICGADDWPSVEDYGKMQEGFLRQFIDMPHGPPSDDTFRRVFMALDPVAFEEVFLLWTKELAGKMGLDVISIDGKTARRSYQSAESPHTALHLVSAWSASNRLVLGQVGVDGKGNEITAIPKLLRLLDLSEAVVTIDGIGCQRKIAEQIIEQQGDYILAVKENQSELLEEIKALMDTLPADSEDLQRNTGHGRTETRKCKVIRRVDLLDGPEKWRGLGCIIRIEATREVKQVKSSETRYYISSLKAGANTFNHAVKMHWGVENSLHWVLDMVFREDECRKRMENSARNFALVRKFALNLLKRDPNKRLGIKNKRLKAGWSQEYLLNVIMNGE